MGVALINGHLVSDSGVNLSAKADLVGGVVPSSQLPSYVDDVLEYANLAAFPATGETGKIYVALDSNKIYRWSGSTYIEISPSVGTAWGGITGTLSNQTDLQNALNAKQNSLNGTGFVRMSGTTVSYITGTSSQFVKADGSLDSSTYVTGGPYLSLSGGTMNGNILFANSTSPNTHYIQFGDNTGWIFRFMTNVTGTPTMRFSFKDNGDFTAVGALRGSSFIRDGGTSSQFLKADGSIDSNTYVTGGPYLALTGGTVTGKVFGRSTSDGTYGGALEIRERGLVSTAQTGWDYSPAITFHWGGWFASRFGLRSDGLLAIDDVPLATRSWVTSQNYATSSSVAGTTNYVSKFTSASAIGNSQIFDNGTNVGIGTTGPLGRLHIYNTATTSDADGSASMTYSNQDSIVLYGHGGVQNQTYGSITWDGNGRRRAMLTAVAESADSDVIGLAFYTRGTDGPGDMFESMRISYGGNVGIGTSSPAARLSVIGEGTGVALIGSAGFVTNNYTAISLNGSLASGTYNFLSSPSDLTLYINRPTGGTIRFRENNVDQVTILSGGNVGIGTTTPAEKLDVYGSIVIRSNYNLTWGSSYGANVPTISGASGVNPFIAFYGAGSTGGEHVRISSAGNVGIGISSPTFKLQVLGASNQQLGLYYDSVNFAAFGSRSNGDVQIYGYTSGTGYRNILLGVDGSTVGGNVGINTISPYSPLDVYTGASYLTIKTNDNVGSSNGFGLNFRINNFSHDIAQIRGNYVDSGNSGSGGLNIYTRNAGTLASRLYIAPAGGVTISSLAGSGTRMVVADANGLLSAQTISGGTVTGTGTTNYIPKFTSASALGDSQIFDNGTNVGIGTTSPGHKLHVAGNINFTGVVKFNGSDTIYGAASDIYMNARVIGNITSAANDGMYLNYNSGGTIGAHLRFYANGATERMRIDASTGYVGIGTSTPGARLSVGAGTGNPISTQFAAVVKGTSSRTIYLDSDSGGASIWWGNGATPHFAIDSISGGGATFWTYASSTWNERMRLLPNGNFLINTTSDAGYKFDVNGTTRFGGTSLFSSAVTFSGDITQKTFTSVVITNLGAASTQARQFEIIRGFYDFNDWSPTGIVEIEVHERQYSRGLMKRYVFSYGYYDSSNLTLVEMVGAGDNNFRVTMGTKTLISGDMYYVPVYLEARYYGSVDVIIRTRRTRTTNNLSTTAGEIYINESPTAVNISDFSSDVTVYPNPSATNQYITGSLGVGVVPTYRLDVSGTGNFSDTLTLSGPSRLAAVSGNSLVFRTSGADRMYLNTSGDLLVGGTYNPYGAANRANITLVGSTNGQILAFATSSVFNGYVYHDNTDMTIANDRNGNIKIFTNAAEVVRITSTGNLGVGTTTPTFTSGKGVHVKFSGDAVIRITSGSNTGFDLQQAVDGTNYIYNRDNSAFVFGTNNTERVRIAADGKLIVNSASSFGAYQFQVNGASYISGAVTLANLAGSGSRMVVADANGLLSTQAIPSGGGGGTGTVTSVGLTTGTSGNDVNVSGSPITSSGTITLNIPDASATARGLVNTGNQTFAGNKTFTGQISINGAPAVTDGGFAMYMLSTYTLSSNVSNTNLYATVDALRINMGSFTMSGGTSYNVCANLNQVSINGSAGGATTQPIRGIISGILGAPGGSAMNITDYRYFEAKSPDAAGIAGHVVTSMFGLRIAQLRGASNFTITNGWGVYQEGTQDNNYFAGSVVIGSATVGSYKLDVTNNLRVNTAQGSSIAIESFVNSAASGSALPSVYSTASGSSIVFGSQANSSYLVGDFVFIGNQSAKFMIAADNLSGAYDGWGTIGASNKHLSAGFFNNLTVKTQLVYNQFFVRKTASYTLALGDQCDVIEMNVGSANTVTVPTNATAAFSIGTQVTITQYGTGQTTIAAASGVTLRSTNNWLKISAQYGSATLVKVATDEWYVIGNLSA